MIDKEEITNGISNILESVCSFQHFFKSVETVSESAYLNKSLGIGILKRDEAFRVC